MRLTIPQLSLVVLIGPSGSGKSTFARKHFLPSEIISSDYCRGLVSDDENDQSATPHAFEVLNFIVAKRLELGKLIVVDATNVQKEAREPLIALARKYHVVPVAIVLKVPEKLCDARNHERSDRNFGPHVVRSQIQQMRRSLKFLKKDGFRYVFELDSPEEIESVAITREPLWTDKRSEHGPFDFIGDVHGCCDELEELLQKLGYQQFYAPGSPSFNSGIIYSHPEGRKAVFVGDLVDRGPRVLDTVQLVNNMVKFGSALCVPGNHDVKLLKHLQGKQVQITHGLELTIKEIEALPMDGAVRGQYCTEMARFLESLVSHYVLDDGKLVVAHAGMKAEYQGRASRRVRDFALYGETTGETDEFGLPVRMNWAADYRDKAMVVYGHTPVHEAQWLNHTINIDTGCVFGGKLTALRYPERELVSVPARKVYREPSRPFLPTDERLKKLTEQQDHDSILDAADVIGKRIVTTTLHGNVTVREENAVAALEVMSRFAVNPQWLIYLPPTMSPCETSHEEFFLEYPSEALNYFRNHEVLQVVCQEKHMGSRAIVVICRNSVVAKTRFGITTGENGIVYTRTGRRFFNDSNVEEQFLNRVRKGLNKTDFWNELRTDWVCLDCELMPWSAKAQELLRSQYAAVGAAGEAALPHAVAAIESARQRLNGDEQNLALELLDRLKVRQHSVSQFVNAYREYCWPVNSVGDLQLAPFHILATEGEVHANRDHVWHMDQIAKISASDPKFLLATPYKIVNLLDSKSETDAINWWLELTNAGGEGMVVKPLNFIARNVKGLIQPAIKCRGREYLRIIYGPEYTAAENLGRLRSRGLSRKRSLALREFALGIEGLERFVKREPLRRVHECVFGVLALESEPVDPRL